MSNQVEELVRGLQQLTTPKEVVDIINSKDAKQIIVPEGMQLLAAAKELEERHHDLEQVINVSRQFSTRTADEMLVATKQIMEETFGRIKGKKSMWGSQANEHEVVTDIVNGRKVTTTCFYGKATIPYWEDADFTVDPRHKALVFEGKKKYATQVKNFFNSIEERMHENSIYSGKAVVVEADPWGNPAFNIFELKVNNHIYLNKDTNVILNKLIIPSLHRDNKRIYLFKGDYGNGKTETAMRVGYEAIQASQTFFYVKDNNMFVPLLNNIENYNPSVVFMEDIDETTSTQERNSYINQVLNTMDGAQLKGKAVRVILTTNHVDRLNKALRRPGRLDAIVSFDNPEAETRAKIITSLLGDCDCTEQEIVDMKFPDVSGAVVAEIAKRVPDLTDKDSGFTCEDIEIAVITMKNQIELMKREPEQDTPADKLYDAIYNLFQDAYNNA